LEAISFKRKVKLMRVELKKIKWTWLFLSHVCVVLKYKTLLKEEQ
jgi:hypothetical protein